MFGTPVLGNEVGVREIEVVLHMALVLIELIKVFGLTNIYACS